MNGSESNHELGDIMNFLPVPKEYHEAGKIRIARSLTCIGSASNLKSKIRQYNEGIFVNILQCKQKENSSRDLIAENIVALASLPERELRRRCLSDVMCSHKVADLLKTRDNNKNSKFFSPEEIGIEKIKSLLL